MFVRVENALKAHLQVVVRPLVLLVKDATKASALTLAANVSLMETVVASCALVGSVVHARQQHSVRPLLEKTKFVVVDVVWTSLQVESAEVVLLVNLVRFVKTTPSAFPCSVVGAGLHVVLVQCVKMVAVKVDHLLVEVDLHVKRVSLVSMESVAQVVVAALPVRQVNAV